MGDLANANKLVRDLEGEVLRSDGRVDELEQHLEDAGRREEDAVVEVRKLQKQVSAMEEAAAAAEAEHQATKAYAAELEEDAAAAVERIESLEAQLADARETIMRMDQAAAQTVEKTESLDRSAKRAAERVRQLEEAIDIASTQLRENEDELAQCKAKIAAQEREQERSVLRQARDREPSASPEEAEIEALEGELDDANKEIAKLTALLQASPARKAIDAAKEARIQMLEREREDLMETVKNLRSTVKDLGTPSRVVNASASSPHPLQGLSLHARTPKTPGGPLRDVRLEALSSHGYLRTDRDICR
jgi:chromosome segregation ATPase